MTPAGRPHSAPVLTAASERLRGVPGFPRRRGRPRKDGDRPVTSVVQVPADTAANWGTLASPATMPRLLNVDQVAVYLGLGPDTVYELVTRGVLRRVRIPAPATAKWWPRGPQDPP